MSKYLAGPEITADYLNEPADAFWMGWAGALKYTASGTFTKASYPGLRGIIVEAQAQGGGGGGTGATGAGTVATASGGGGGGFVRAWIPVDTLGTSETVTIGTSGGTGGTGTGAASAGANTTFGSLVTAVGGGAGESMAASSASTRTQGGDAGTGSVSGAGVVELFYRPGMTGGSGYCKGTTACEAGVGGDSYNGSGGRVSAANSGGNGITPTTGAYGAGGSGAWADVSQSAFNGGNGLAGVCRVIPVY